MNNGMPPQHMNEHRGPPPRGPPPGMMMPGQFNDRPPWGPPMRGMMPPPGPPGMRGMMPPRMGMYLLQALK